MKSLAQEIDIVQKELVTAITTSANETSLEAIRVEFLGRKGKIANLMEQLKNLPVEEKKIVGPLLNQLKRDTQKQLDAHAELLKQKELAKKDLAQKNFDVSAYKYNELKGTSHIYTQIISNLLLC